MRKFLTVLLCALGSAAFIAPAHADEPALLQPGLILTEPANLPVPTTATASVALSSLPFPQPMPAALTPSLTSSLMTRAVDSVQSTLDQAMDYLGVRYRRGGATVESGFDCSGFVRSVFAESLGLVLPHNAKAISQAGERITKTELQPGDLVFFNTMRRAFSHVGIYLGNDLFVHAPRTGGKVRIEDMTDRYWKRRFDGARRVQPE
jgi:cell wall-associated NlpC family hydrolase